MFGVKYHASYRLAVLRVRFKFNVKKLIEEFKDWFYPFKNIDSKNTKY